MLHAGSLRQLLVCATLLTPSSASRVFTRYSIVRKMSAPSEPAKHSLIICGPSGVGKGTICNMLLSKFPRHVATCVSHTTRRPRPTEVNGVHYHFVGNEAMRHQISDKKFLEHAEVHGCLYGTSFESLEAVWRTNRICLLDIDVNGLEKRLRGRGTESSEQIDRRMKTAEDEMEYATGDDEPFDFILINADLAESEKLLTERLKEWFPDIAWEEE